MANNRELSQFGSFISVNDINKKITIGSTITKVLTDELKVNGISTVGFLTATDINVSGIITASTFKGNFVGVASLTDLNVTGITTVGVLTGTDAYFTGIVTATKFVVLTAVGVDEINTNRLTVTGISSLGITTASSLEVTGITTLGTVKISSGIITSSNPGITTVFYYGDGSGLINVYSATTGISSEATKLETPRDFKITGDIVSTIVSFDGTSNVSLASTISDNAVGLGTKTYGDYVKNITGTANEIEVSVTSGAQVSPQIGLPNDVTISQDLQINRNLNVTGNITVGGTSAYLNVVSLQVKDRDIVLGITTNGSGIDVSTDITANHGGIAIASTEGNPLISLRIAGINSLPDTYKQIMWLKKGTFAGLNTDAWLSNYAIGIGSTQIANGVRLAVGTGITMSDDNITAGYYYGDGSNLTNIKASSISGNITGAAGSVTVFSDSTNLTRYISFVEGTSGVSSVRANSSLAFNPSTTRLGIGTANPTSTLQVQGDLKVTGVSTLGSVKIYSSGNNGIVTSSNPGVSTVFYYGDGSNLTNIKTSAISGDIGLGTNTYGDYVKNITGTANEIEVSVTSGEQVSPQIGLPNDVTIGNDLTVSQNLYVSGNITVGGTTAALDVTNLQVKDKNIILGVTTSPSTGADASTDFSASQGGIAIASTEGTPLVKLGITSIPNTYKQILWFKSNSLTGLSTDAWIFNYGVGIGSTQIANGVRLAVGTGITMSDGSITAGYFYGDGSGLTKIKASSISGASTITISANNSDQTQYLTFATGVGTVTGLNIDNNIGLVYNPSSERLGIGTTNPTSTLQVQGDLKVTGVSTLGSVKIYSSGNNGIVTATSVGATVFYYGDGSGLINIPSTAVSGGSSISISSNTNNQTQYLTFANGTGSTTGLGITTSGLVFNPSSTRLGIGTTNSTATLHVEGGAIVTGVSTLGSVKIYSSGNIGIITSTTPGVTTVTYYGDGSKLSGITAAASAGGTTGQVQFNNNGVISGASYFNYDSTNVRVGIGTSVPTARLSVSSPTSGNSLLLVNDNLSDGSLFRVSNSAGSLLVDVDSGGTILFPTSGNVGIGTTLSTPTTKLQVQGDITANYYYGDGSTLKNLGLGGIGITNTNLSTIVYPTLAANTTSGIATVGIATTALSFNTSTNTILIGSGITMYGSTGIISATRYYGDGSYLKLPTFSIAGTTGQVLYNNNGQIDAAANLNYNTTTGNVGIGTTLATARLSVSNPTSGSSLLLVNDNLSDGSLFRVSNSVGSLLVDVDSGGTILFPTTGNVGIGTTLVSPTSKLQVDGDVRVGVNTSQGIILTSPNGTKYRLFVSNVGIVSTVLVS